MMVIKGCDCTPGQPLSHTATCSPWAPLPMVPKDSSQQHHLLKQGSAFILLCVPAIRHENLLGLISNPNIFQTIPSLP